MKKITLKASLYIAEGERRKVYHHPSEPDLCIKVLKPGASARTLHREIRYVKRYSKKVDYIPKYHGKILTNKGEGHIFGLVRDADGAVSQSLEDILKDAPLPSLLEKVIASYESLLQNRILITDLHARNIAIQRDGHDYKLHYIDGAENTDFIKACDYSKIFLKRKLSKKFTRFSKGNNLQYDFTTHEVKTVS